MKHIPIFLILSVLCGSCSLFSGEAKTTTYIVIDKSTNAALSAYDCDESDRVIGTRTYDVDQTVLRSRSFEYDEDGYVRSMVETELGEEPKTITYATVVTRGIDNRIEKVTQTPSDGVAIESYFAYDPDTKVLRGTVVKTGDSVIMKDYEDE